MLQTPGGTLGPPLLRQPWKSHITKPASVKPPFPQRGREEGEGGLGVVCKNGSLIVCLCASQTSRHIHTLLARTRTHTHTHTHTRAHGLITLPTSCVLVTDKCLCTPLQFSAMCKAMPKPPFSQTSPNFESVTTLVALPVSGVSTCVSGAVRADVARYSYGT